MAAQSIYGTADISVHTPLSEATIQTRRLAGRHKGEVNRPLDHRVINPLHDQYSNEARSDSVGLLLEIVSSHPCGIDLHSLFLDFIDACSGAKQR